MVFWMLAAAVASTDALPSALGSSCATCHAVPKAESIPELTKDAATLRRQLLALRDGEQAGTTMPRLLHGLSDQEVEALVRELTATWCDTP